MSKKKTEGKSTADMKAAKFLTDIKATCPPDLHTAFTRAGGLGRLAKALGISEYPLKRAARDEAALTPAYQRALTDYLEGKTMTKADAQTPAEPAVVIPPWDKKTTAVKLIKSDGSKQTLKVPALVGELFARHGGVKTAVAAAMGYTSWSGIETAIEKGKYEAKVHARAYRAVNGLPMPSNGKPVNDEYEKPDTFSLGLAICFVHLSDYERLEDLAEVMGCVLVFKMTAGSSGWVVIYRNPHKDKLEKFKRLGKRDAKKIVCP